VRDCDERGELRYPAQILCYQQIRENAGSGTLIALIMDRLLFTSTPEQLGSLLPQADAEYLLLKEHGSVTAAGDRGFRSLFGDEGDTGVALEKFCPQGLWTRAVHVVTPCSNRVERFHPSLTNATDGRRNLPHRRGALF
jgi:hypothetical protein